MGLQNLKYVDHYPWYPAGFDCIEHDPWQNFEGWQEEYLEGFDRLIGTLFKDVGAYNFYKSFDKLQRARFLQQPHPKAYSQQDVARFAGYDMFGRKVKSRRK